MPDENVCILWGREPEIPERRLYPEKNTPSSILQRAHSRVLGVREQDFSVLQRIGR